MRYLNQIVAAANNLSRRRNPTNVICPTTAGAVDGGTLSAVARMSGEPAGRCFPLVGEAAEGIVEAPGRPVRRVHVIVEVLAHAWALSR